MKACEVLKILQISRQTLYNYHKRGLIRSETLPSGKYSYNEEDVFKFLNKDVPRKNVIYCRVSTNKQKKDLESQEETLKAFCLKNGVIINDIFKDIGSGINFDRKEFQRLVDEVVNYKISKVYITYKDRLSRISFDLFKNLFKNFSTQIIVLNEINDDKTLEKEIFNEIISLIHCFAMKVYSNRRKEKLKLIEKDLTLEDQNETSL
jgi:predicted site-specific integrase-resolvase